MKNNLLCTPDKRILWLSKTCDGHVHDKKIQDEQPLTLSKGITLWQDTSFLGHNPKDVTVKCRQRNPRVKSYRMLKKRKTEKSQVFEFLLNMPLVESKNVIL